MPLAINTLGHGHTHINMQTNDLHRIIVKKPGAHWPVAVTMGLRGYISKRQPLGYRSRCDICVSNH